MGLPEDLLEQAKDLAGFEAKKPKQASLRRAVSASYYALFHLLVRACAQVLASGGSQLLRGRLSRVLDHTEMADACKRFSVWVTNQPPSLYQAFFPQGPSTNLRKVSSSFIELQQQRHDADYDLTRSFLRSQVLEVIDRAEESFELFNSLQNDCEERKVFLLALVFHRRLSKGSRYQG